MSQPLRPSSTTNLQRLAIIRSLLLAGLLLLAAYGYYGLAMPLNLTALLPTLTLLTLITALTLWRCRRPWPVTDYEFFGQILVDIGGLSVLLYFSGGATNPFVSYYLVPLCISASVLPWVYTWIVAAGSLGLYTLLLFYYQPLPDLMPSATHAGHHGHQRSGVDLHILGMWLNFSLSALLVTFFVVRMAQALRQREAQLAVQREDELRDEQIVAVATLAAGTAHELGTLLSTITLLLDEMEAEHSRRDKALSNDIQLLKQQVERCRQTLKGLVRTAAIHDRGEKPVVAIDQFLKQTLEHWQVLRPDADYQLSMPSPAPAPQLAVDTTLEQAICNLLNNAIDASSQRLEVELRWDRHHITISIRDHGPGIPLELAEQIGKPFVTSKGKGLGLGLFLSHATVQRYGGSIRLYNHPQQGTVAELCLPTEPHKPS